MLGQDARPRADGALRRRRCASSGAASGDRTRARRRRRGRRLGRAARRRSSPPGCRSSTTAASTSARRSSAADLALAGVATFGDLDRLTIFADNLVPHVLRCDGVLRYDRRPRRPHRRRRAAAAGRAQEREIRACARARLRAARARASASRRATLDNWLWNRGQAPRYKARPAPPHAARPPTELSPPAGSLPATAPQRPHLGGPLAARCRQVGDQPLQLADPARPAPCIASATGSGRWIQSASGPSGRGRRRAPDGRGCRRRSSSRGTSWMTTLLAPIFAPWPTSIGPSSLAPEPIVTLSPTVGWRLPRLEAGAAERHALVERHVRRRSPRSRRSRRRRRGR